MVKISAYVGNKVQSCQHDSKSGEMNGISIPNNPYFHFL